MTDSPGGRIGILADSHGDLEATAEADFRILFCGHAHRPILFRQQDGFVTREPLPAGVPVAVRPHGRYIMIAGAACDGECALYDGAAGTYERLPPGRRLSI